MKSSRRNRAKPEEPARPAPSKSPEIWLFALLAVATLGTYAGVLHAGFINYDDPSYVTQNVHVRDGLTGDGVVWAFAHSFAGNWFPLTWISHMLDCQFFGLDAGMHHLTNVAIHVLATLLLFAVLRRITGAALPSAMVAALFALHPLHVESVAWIAERKDVLSAFFWMATLAAYARYVQRPTAQWYGITLLAFALGLMAKPMLVTLPLVLFLLDYWPFARGLHIREKLPFLALSAAVSVVTYLVHAGVSVVSLEALPLGLRLENVLVSYVVYIGKMFWPSGLAVFYPYPTGSLALPAVFAGLGLGAVTAGALLQSRRRPYLIVGWLWYLVTLAPVIGLVQAGQQARADRYMYIPMIGLSIALVWGAAELLRAWPTARTALAVAICAVCAVLTWLQVGYWQDSVALFQHTVEVTGDNFVARYNLANALDARGDDAEAATQLVEAVRIRPNSGSAHAELGQIDAKLGRNDEALSQLQAAVRLEPDDARNHYRIGLLLAAAGRTEDASAEFGNAIRLEPEDEEAHYNLGIARAIQGRVPEAAAEFEAAVRLRPDDANARFNFGMALANQGRMQEAVSQLSEAVRLKPDFDKAREALEEITSGK
jgi:Flp pilus assembly protein TadD